MGLSVWTLGAATKAQGGAPSHHTQGAGRKAATRGTMNGEPIRNTYLRSELANFLRTLATIAAGMPDAEYRRGWLAALAAMAMLVGIEFEGGES